MSIRLHGNGRGKPPALRDSEKRNATSFMALAKMFAALGTPPVDACIEYGGRITEKGYGRYGLLYVHRASFEFFVDPISDGMAIDHLCRNKRCWNPNHLEAVTPEENHRRWVATLPRTCVRGHERNAENTYARKDGGRQCRACQRERRRELKKAAL